MDNVLGASPRHYGAPIAKTLYYQDQASRSYRRIAQGIPLEYLQSRFTYSGTLAASP